MHALKSRLLSLLCQLTVILGLTAAPDPSITTDGFITIAPQINALVWTNRGTVSLFPSIAFTTIFETQNTVRYVNRGNISTFPGIWFGTIDDFGVRTPAEDFINEAGRSVLSELETLTYNIAPNDAGNPGRQLYGGYITVLATNVVNRGIISTSYGGDLRIYGENVDLQRGGLGNAQLGLSSHAVANDGTFFPEVGIEDVFWGYGGNLRVFYGPGSLGSQVTTNDTAFGPIMTASVSTTAFDRTSQFGSWRAGMGGGPGFRVFCLTNQVNPTNKIVEIAFVRVPDPNVFVDVGWTGSTDAPDNPHSTAWIRFSSFGTNLLTLQPESSHLTLVDNYASETSDLLLNNQELERLFRPTNIFLERSFNQIDLGDLLAGNPIPPPNGQGPNAEFFPEIYSRWIDETNFPAPGIVMTNGALVGFTDGGYATWAARIDSLPSRNPTIIPINDDPNSAEFIFGLGGQFFQEVPQASFTNYSGRVFIDAKNLNLERTRLQGRGSLVVKTDNLISSRNATLEAPIISLELGVQPRDSRELVVENMMRPQVTRLGGNLVVVSYAFSNFFTMTVTNATGTPIDTDGDGVNDACDTDGDGVADSMEPCPTDAGGEEITHNAFYHVTVVDTTIRASQLQYVDRMELRAESSRIADSGTIQRGFFADATKLTVDGEISFDGITNLNKGNTPNLKELIVGAPGSVFVPGLFTIGLDRPGEMDQLTVSGALTGSSLDIMAGTVDSMGSIFAYGGQATIAADTLNVTGGDISAAFEITLAAAKANLSGGIITSSGEVIVDVSEELTDGGMADATTILTSYGIRILQLPPVARINGVTVDTAVPNFAEAIHVWPGEDRGATRAGFDNNLSIKTLVLDSGLFSTLTFRGIGENNALYVETLEMSDALLADIEAALNIDPSFTIYYSNTVGIPPELLDGSVFPPETGGKLVWVKDGSPADPNRLVPVQLGDGRTVNVPYSLRDSATIDSDNDGIVNRLDASPFDAVMLADVKLNATKTGVEVYWKALPGATYEVQASDSLGSNGWSKIQLVQNPAATEALLKAEDGLGEGNSARIYRVIITP